MNLDSAESIDYFNKRFHNCDDGVIRGLQVIFRSGSNHPSRILVALSVRDAECTDNSGFVNVRLTFLEVSEFSFSEGEISYQVLSEGMKTMLSGDVIFVTFNPHDNPESVAAFRESHFYVAAKRIEWKVLPYKEYEGYE